MKKVSLKIPNNKKPKKTNKFVRFLKEWWIGIVLAAVIVALISLIVGGIFLSIQEDKKEKEYFNSLTPEQQQVYIEQEEAIRQANIKKYEVISAFRYIEVKTNDYGGKGVTYIYYAFEYIDENGELKLEKEFTEVKIGDENLYVVDKNDNGGEYLQLTKETLAEMENK